jgi:hypothetical protein
MHDRSPDLNMLTDLLLRSPVLARNPIDAKFSVAIFDINRLVTWPQISKFRG